MGRDLPAPTCSPLWLRLCGPVSASPGRVACLQVGGVGALLVAAGRLAQDKLAHGHEAESALLHPGLLSPPHVLAVAQDRAGH